MPAHTKMLHTKSATGQRGSSSEHGSRKRDEEEGVSAEDIIKKIRRKRPEGAVCLRGLRYRENLTQKELGDLLGIDQANISKMERGIRAIGKNIAKRLAALFKIDYRLFL